MRLSRLTLSIALTLGTACNGSSNAPSTSDAAVAPVQSQAAERVLATLRAMPAFAGHLGEGASLVRVEHGFELPRKGFVTSGASLVVTAPHHANEALRIADPKDGFSLEIKDDSLRAASPEVRGGALVYANAFAGGDLTHVIEEARVEEIRVVQSTGKSTTRYALHTSTGAEIRLRDGRIEVYDQSGKRRVTTAPMFAVDAKGARVTPKLELAGDGSDRVLTVSFDTTGMTAPIAIDPMWQLTSSTALPSASDPLMVATGPTNAMLFAGTPWSYDAVTDTWAVRAGTVTGHGSSEFSATLVPSLNKILIAGGGSNNHSELYSFGASFGGVASGDMATVRFGHAAVLLGDGGSVPERVLVTGGRPDGSSYFATTAWWDPGTGAWSPRASMAVPRVHHGAAVFTNAAGKQLVLVAGGHNTGDSDPTGEVYDPVANTWTNVSNNMAVARDNNVTVALPNHKVLVAGGSVSTYCCTYTETTSLYDPATNSFSAGPSMKYLRSGAAGLLLPNGKVLVAGGSGHKAGTSDPNTTLKTTEIYDPVANSWSDGPDLVNARTEFPMVALSSGRALAGPGIAGGYVTSAEIFVPDPTTCTTTGPGCASCVDGYCCDNACAGQCQACDVSGREGVCSFVNGEAPHGSRASCSPFLTCAYSAAAGSSACATSCTGDTACASTSFCSGGTCVGKKSNGAACSGSNQCTSGQCVDGFCCASACTGQCNSCGEAGKEGVCSPIDGAPRGTRPACPTGGYGCAAGACASACSKDAECVGSNYCNGSACVPKQANGATCTGNAQCASNACSDGYCCAAACTGACNACGPSGTCSAVASGPVPAGKTCGAYANCSAGSCSSTCSVDGDCASGFFCNASNKCVVRKTNGAACLGNSECTSGSCASGVCCDVACNGECEACNLAGSIGTCKAKSAGGACGLAGCVGGYTVATSTCDGTARTCPLGAITPCPNGVKCLDKVSCKSACAADSDCVVGACDTASGKCVSSWDGGVDTGADSTTDSDLSDSSAGDSAPPDATASDSSTGADLGIADVPEPPFKGDTKIVGDFQRCTKGSECSTGHCVEGVCCDTACNDRCHSCALLTSPGKCTLEPVGVDLKSECGPALSCLGTCGPGGECIGSGNGTMCARNRCTGPSTGAGPAYCAAPGASCNTDEAVPFDCAPYICEPAFGACRSACATSSDCAQGFVCDVGSKTCVAAPTAEGATSGDGGSGGCALSPRETKLSTAGWALLAIAIGALRRKNRSGERDLTQSRR